MDLYRIDITGFVNVEDETTKEQIKNGILALQNNLLRANAVETSTIKIHLCKHNQEPYLPCDPPIYTWEKE